MYVLHECCNGMNFFFFHGGSLLRDEECMVMVSFYINVNKAVALSATEGQSSRVILNTIRNEPLLLLAQPHLEGPRGEHSMDFF